MDSKASSLRLSFGLAVWWLASASLHAQITNLVANGSFEFPFRTSGANHVIPASELLPWHTSEDAVLVWVPVLPSELAADGRQHVEVVSLWQTVPTIPGEDYRLSFRHAPRPGVDSTLNVQLNTQTIRTFAENGAAMNKFNWQRFATNFTATSDSTTIRFDGFGIPGNAHLDDVVLERLPVNSTIRVSEVEVRWESVATKSYQIQYRSSVTTNLWTDLSGAIQGNGGTMIIRDSVPDDGTQRFYRVSTIP